MTNICKYVNVLFKVSGMSSSYFHLSTNKNNNQFMKEIKASAIYIFLACTPRVSLIILSYSNQHKLTQLINGGLAFISD